MALLMPMQIDRMYSGALDSSSVFANKTERLAYLTSPLAYEGQIVSQADTGEIFVIVKDEYDKHKYIGIATSGENNECAIELIKINGEELEIVDKTVDIDLKAVVENYYDKEEVDDLINNSKHVTEDKLAETLSEYTNTTTLETKLEDYVLDEDIDVMSEDEVLALLNLSDEKLEGLSQVINDDEIRLDKAFSSSKVYHDILKCLVDSKAYTLEQIALNNTASYKVVASVDDIIEDRYIYLLDNGTNFDMYIIDGETGLPVDIGTTDIDLSEYLKATDADDAYASKTDLEIFEDSIGDVANLTTDNKTVVGAINEVISEMATTEELNDYLPLTGGTIKSSSHAPLNIECTSKNMATIGCYGGNGFLGALGINGQNVIFVNSSEVINNILHTGNMGNHVLPIRGGTLYKDEADNENFGGRLRLSNATNSTIGALTIVERWKDAFRVWAQGSGTDKGAFIDFTKCENNCSSEILHTGNMETYIGKNIPKTTFEFTNSTNWSIPNTNLETFYVVKNGWCFLHVVARCNVVASDDNSTVFTGLPIPPFQVYSTFPGNDNTYEPCQLTVGTGGQMILRGGTVGKDYSFTYTYPVADS